MPQVTSTSIWRFLRDRRSCSSPQQPLLDLRALRTARTSNPHQPPHCSARSIWVLGLSQFKSARRPARQQATWRAHLPESTPPPPDSHNPAQTSPIKPHAKSTIRRDNLQVNDSAIPKYDECAISPAKSCIEEVAVCEPRPQPRPSPAVPFWMNSAGGRRWGVSREMNKHVGGIWH